MNLFLHGKTFLATAAVAFTLAVAVLNAAPNNRTFPPADPMKKETQIPVSLGKTSLLDIGLYQVTCQSYGKDAILLPPNFMGSDIATGVIYDPSFQQDGKKALLLHSPWKLPAGSTWVDYQLLLPEATPLKLQFAVAMRHGVVDATHSDGGTFSAYVAEPGQEPRELYREHICGKALRHPPAGRARPREQSEFRLLLFRRSGHRRGNAVGFRISQASR